MVSRADRARNALSTVPSLHKDFHEGIINALDAAGLLDQPSNGGPVRAAAGRTRIERVNAERASNPSAEAAFAFATGALRARGIALEEFIDEDGEAALHKLDRAMSAKSIGPEQRINVKTALARCGLID